MPETAQQAQTKTQVAEQTATDFQDLISGAIGARSDTAKSAVRNAVSVFAHQVLENADLVVAEDVTSTISAYIAEIDRKLSEQVNQIIHHEDFKTLEGTWRGLAYLVNNTETSERLQIKVINVTKKELTKTLAKFKGTAWDQSPLFKQIYEEEYGTLGGNPFGCFVGDYYWDHSPQDVQTLAGMAQICAASHAPFISAASPRMLGMESWQDLNNPRDIEKIFGQKEYLAWKALRESEDARYLGLTLPRFVARQPYGAKTVPVEEFNFEEDAEGGDHSKYVWSNAAYAMGRNINRAFANYGWCTQIRGVEAGGLVDNLPCHTFATSDGDTDVKTPTEVAIPDRREAELGPTCGLIPLCYRKNSTDAAFIGAQSLQKPKKYEGKGAAEANQSAQLSARLPYLFATCRFAHYLKCMVRDKVGKMMERSELQTYLQEWINNYVIANPENAGEEAKAQRPLSGAEVEVKEVEGNPGYYNAVFRLRPHYQLEAVNVSLRLVGKLKQGGG
jgi:type VI secretion system protein ImpC